MNRTKRANAPVNKAASAPKQQPPQQTGQMTLSQIVERNLAEQIGGLTVELAKARAINMGLEALVKHLQKNDEPELPLDAGPDRLPTKAQAKALAQKMKRGTNGKSESSVA